MSQAMIDYWVGFAYGQPPILADCVVGGRSLTFDSDFDTRSPSGNVNREAVVPWPTLDTTSESLLLIDTPISQTQYNSEECDFWVRSSRCTLVWCLVGIQRLRTAWSRPAMASHADRIRWATSINRLCSCDRLHDAPVDISV